MKKTTILVLIIVAVIAVGGYALYANNKTASDTANATDRVAYTSKTYGISFTYPKGYLLAEKEQGDVGNKFYDIMLMEDNETNQKFRDGTLTGTDGPVAITVNIYPNAGKLSLADWVKQTHTSNYTQIQGTYTSTTVGDASIPALKYSWDGLYQGDSVVFAQGDYIVMASVTYMDTESKLRADFAGILSSMKLTTPTATISTTPPATDTDKIYTNTGQKFSVVYPADFKVNEDYVFALGPDKEISGVSFIVPAALAKGTNLGSDSYVSVETLNKAKCTAADFVGDLQKTETITEKGKTYTVWRSSGAGAGNRYEEIVYSLGGCRAIRYFIHTSVLENYDPGTVTAFDRTALVAKFDKIRWSYRAL